jgi:hypothetical protein
MWALICCTGCPSASPMAVSSSSLNQARSGFQMTISNRAKPQGQPVVVQYVQRGRGAAAGDHRGEGCEAVVAVGSEQVVPPLGVGRRAAVGTTDLLHSRQR